MRNRNRRWLVAWILILPCVAVEIDSEKEIKSAELKEENGHKSSKEARGIFAPRLDYDQWTPLGMGDPLKNDPTYDYVPPELDRVRYWIDPESRLPDHPIPEELKKTEILLLGVTSKKPSTGTTAATDFNTHYTHPSGFRNDDIQIPVSRKDAFDPFLKMVEGPKFNSPNNFQKISKPHFAMSSYYPSTQFSQNKHKSDHRMPYTMLVPPPLQTPEDPRPHQKQSSSMPSMSSSENNGTPRTPHKGSTKSIVTVEQAKIRYQSSTYGDLVDYNNYINTQNKFGSFPSASNQVVYKTSKPDQNGSFSDFLLRPSGLITVSDSMEKSRNNSGKILTGFTHNSFLSVIDNSNKPSEIMIKGQVSDADLGLANTYVNIGKAEAQMHSPSGISGIAVDPPKMSVAQPPMIMNVHQHPSPMSATSPPHLKTSMRKPGEMGGKIRPVTLQVLQTMQTMQPPPPPTSLNTPGDGVQMQPFIQQLINDFEMNTLNKPQNLSTNSIHSLLEKEKIVAETNTDQPILLPTMIPEMSSTTVPPTTTTEENISMTTDPLFKHYKQPTEPIRGPFYLIIQGHSKVKTYGPNKQFHGINVQDTNEISTDDSKSDYAVKHLHQKIRKNAEDNFSRGGRANNLQTLSHVLQTGFGSLNLQDFPSNRRTDVDVQEAELGARYDVSSQEKTTSERYYKGIVEAGDISRKLKDVNL